MFLNHIAGVTDVIQAFSPMPVIQVEDGTRVQPDHIVRIIRRIFVDFGAQTGRTQKFTAYFCQTFARFEAIRSGSREINKG